MAEQAENNQPAANLEGEREEDEVELEDWTPFLTEDAASSLQTQGTLQLYQPTLDIHTLNLFDITKLDKPGTYIPDYS